MIHGRKRTWTAIAVGAFLTAGLVGFMALILVQGGTRNLFERHFPVRVRLTDASGIVPGAPVRMLGLRIGTVDSVALAPGNAVDVRLTVEETYRSRIRFDPAVYPLGTEQPPSEPSPAESSAYSVVRVQNPNLIGLGDLSLIVQPSSPPLPEIRDGMYLPVRPYSDPAGELIDRITKIAHGLENEGSISNLLKDGGRLYNNLSTTVEELEKFTRALNVPDGSLQKFLNDGGSLHRDTNDAVSDLRAVSGEIRGASLAGKLDELLRQVREILDSIRGSAGTIGKTVEEVPGILDEARHTFHASADASEAIKRHWLIYSYVTPERVPEQLRILDRRSRYK